MANQRETSCRGGVRQFHTDWTHHPADQVIINAGIRALRLYLDRTSQAAEPDSPGGNPTP